MPELLTGAAPEDRLADLEGAAERGFVHEREYKYLAGLVVLADGGDEPVGVELDCGWVDEVGGGHLEILADGDALFGQIFLGVLHGEVFVVEDGGGEHGVGLAFG